MTIKFLCTNCKDVLVKEENQLICNTCKSIPAIVKDNIIVYHLTRYRSEKDELGIKWNDNELKINWEIKKPILSKKDKTNLSLNKFLKNKK